MATKKTRAVQAESGGKWRAQAPSAPSTPAKLTYVILGHTRNHKNKAFKKSRTSERAYLSFCLSLFASVCFLEDLERRRGEEVRGEGVVRALSPHPGHEAPEERRRAAQLRPRRQPRRGSKHERQQRAVRPRRSGLLRV